MATPAKKKRLDLVKRPQDQIFKLHISVSGTAPLVWRRVMVPGIFTLEALHSIIQLAMGWQMTHLYDFRIGDDRYADDDEGSAFSSKQTKSVATSLTAALRDLKIFRYNYDFGDDWHHEISVEEISVRDERFNYPICIAGENACPPEDCGGLPGYEELKEKISDLKHPEHFEAMRWLGGFFDPKSFDPNRVNRDMLWMIDWNQGPNEDGLYLPFNGDE